MKKITVIALLSAAALLFLQPPARTAGEASSEKWVVVKKGNGIVSYGMPGSKDPVKKVYAVGIVNAPVPVIEALLRDVDSHNKYVHMVTEAKKIELPARKNAKDLFFEYCRLGMPWPVWDRDAVGQCEFLYHAASGELWVHIKGYRADDFKPNPRTIRMPVTNLDFRLVPKGPAETEVTYSIEADPSIALAPFILDMLFKTLAYNTIKNMREMVKLDPYRNANAVVTTTPWKR